MRFLSSGLVFMLRLVVSSGKFVFWVKWVSVVGLLLNLWLFIVIV